MRDFAGGSAARGACGGTVMKRIFPGSFPVVLALVLFPALTTAAEPQRLSQAAFSFGLATQTDGEVLVVGAPDEAVDGNAAQGAAYVYELREGAWQEVARLTAPDGDALDRFGSAMAVDGNVLLVAAPNAPAGTLPEAGAVYVFERTADGAWTGTAKVVADDASTMARFGASLALDGERMVVAAPGAPGELEAYVGAAYVFDRDAGASWQQTARLTRGDRFATDVDVSGDRLAIATGIEQGFVYTYHHDGSGWAFELPVQPAAGNDNKVALENDVLAVGTPDDVLADRPWSNVGAVHIFERGAVAWEHVAEFHQEFPGPLGMFGDYLDMNDGLIAAAGSGENAGGVSLIRKNETGEWVQTFPPAGVVEFGGSLAVSALALAAGGPSGEGGNIYVLEMAELLTGEAADDEPAGGTPDDSDDPDLTGSGIGAVENDDGGVAQDDDSIEDVDAIEDDSDAGSIIDTSDPDGLDADAVEDDSDAGSIIDTTGNSDTAGDPGDGSTGDAGGDPEGGNSANVAMPLQRDDGGGGSAGWMLGMLALLARRSRKQQER